MKRKTLLAVLVFALTTVTGTQAQADDNAVCTVSGSLTLKPGLTLMSGKSKYFSHGYDGTIDCHGSVKGYQITGPGTLTNRGTISGSCSQSMGNGRFIARIPTDGGAIRLPGKYSFQTFGAAGPFSGPVFSGTFEFLAEAGDCVSAPLTRVTVVAQGILTT